MDDSQILSTFVERARRRPPAPAAPALVFDACQVGVVLRAVLYVEVVVAVAVMYAADSAADWLTRVSLLTAGVLPATLLWLIVGCALKRPLARLSEVGQMTAGVALGGLAGLYACAMLALLRVTGSPPWLASTCTGALLAAGLVAALVWRVRGRTPAATTARLAELQSRIRPHFLFNTLNSAIALVRAEPAKAELILEDLADLFRHALTDQEGSSTVGQEIELARRYLEIEQVRFGRRLRIEWALDDRVNDARLPPLILQPLVENAVKHGVEPSPHGAQLRVSTQLRGPIALIKVTNTVPAGQGAAGHGIALANVRSRLKLLHDLHGGFRTALVDGVYQARIEVPMPEKATRA
ncbi:sensor histidine kinase [Ottowia sp. GY511]|uniref:Sensor histidine kinase n=1 Tax=Ottowia flava TaxID=2675430 RepID=A0ABW4KV07_9BURK|nr:histidine kinase [Ottowia sp. GY511]TXK33315.1 sensor histidine kinase [Ottowia sp. GY511]